MKKVLLDTSGYSRLLKGDKLVRTEIEASSAIYFSVIVIGELLAAFKNGAHEIKNKNILEKFIQRPQVIIVHVTQETADIYAQVVHILKKQGTPIPINDVWIAAHVIETGAKLITHDGHFSKIPGLRIWEFSSGN